MLTPANAKETYRRVYRSMYPILDNRTRRTFAYIRRKFGAQVALDWLCTQDIPWDLHRLPELPEGGPEWFLGTHGRWR